MTKRSKRVAATEVPLIAHVIYRLAVGGTENGLVNLLNRLPQDRFRHAIICLTEVTDFADRITAGNVQLFELNKSPGKDPAFYRRFWRLMRRLQPTIVHTRNLGTLDLAPIAALAGVPVRIHGEHGWDASDPQGTNAKYRLLRRACDRFIHGYVAVSSDIAEWLHTVIGIRPRKVHEIRNGVDTERFCPGGDAASLPFESSGSGATVVGTVARLDPIKGLNVLLEAFEAVVERSRGGRSRPRLVIVGDGPEFGRLESDLKSKDLSDLVWLSGARSDVPALLRSFDIFALSSLNEGTSNTILEAMSTGLPVVATNVGGNPRLLLHDVTGELVPAKSPADLADALSRYLDDGERRERHGRAGRERAQQEFSIAAMASAYQRMYATEIDQRNSKAA